MAGAGYRNWTAGEIPTAAQFDTFLQEQTNMRFASAAARDTALSAVLAEGMVAYLDDTNVFTVYTGSAWSTYGPVSGSPLSWTPSWTGFTTTNATIVAEYWRVGRLITFQLDVQWGASTAITGDVSFTLPVGLSNSIGIYFGGCTLYDNTGTTLYPGAFVSKDADEAWIRNASGSTFSALSSTLPFTWATGDRFRGIGNYQAAADA